MSDPEGDAISLAEKILNLLDQGRITSTYKYAVLLSLLDLVLEQTSKYGVPPQTITTRQLAEKTIEIYWPHTNPFPTAGSVLLQNAGAKTSQAEIVSAIVRFRTTSEAGPLASFWRAKALNLRRYDALVSKVEWKLIEMPLPRLQRIGREHHSFLYEYDWEDPASYRDVHAYQAGQDSEFDNRLFLSTNVAESLVKLNALLRPLIQREWSLKVANINALPEAQLQRFLFGSVRSNMGTLRDSLVELQGNRCFYCARPVGTQRGREPEVDHFVPWSRYPNDGLANLVVAHKSCNNAKRDFLATHDHVEAWLERFKPQSGYIHDLNTMANEIGWDIRFQESLGVASAIYLHLTSDLNLWREKDIFESAEPERLSNAFSSTTV